MQLCCCFEVFVDFCWEGSFVCVCINLNRHHVVSRVKSPGGEGRNEQEKETQSAAENQ